MKIVKGGRISYDFEKDHIMVDNFHFDGEGKEANMEDVILCLINALRRNLYNLRKGKDVAEWDQPIKALAADVKPAGWWANE